MAAAVVAGCSLLSGSRLHQAPAAGDVDGWSLAVASISRSQHFAMEWDLSRGAGAHLFALVPVILMKL